MSYRIAYSCVCHIGKVRRTNQDNIVYNGSFLENDSREIEFFSSGSKEVKDAPVFAVFDGMGGEECGEIASYLAAKRASALKIGRDAASDFSQFCQRANEDICAYMAENGISSMGTTAAMLAFTDDGVTLCNVGDSKIFRYCDGRLEQISKDHLAPAPFGKKPPLLQNLGIPPNELVIEPYLAQGVCQKDDIYLICSDGLTDMVTTEEITQALSSGETERTARELLEMALVHGGRDNISIILCKIERKAGWPFSRLRRS